MQRFIVPLCVALLPLAGPAAADAQAELEAAYLGAVIPPDPEGYKDLGEGAMVWPEGGDMAEGHLIGFGSFTLPSDGSTVFVLTVAKLTGEIVATESGAEMSQSVLEQIVVVPEPAEGTFMTSEWCEKKTQISPNEWVWALAEYAEPISEDADVFPMNAKVAWTYKRLEARFEPIPVAEIHCESWAH